MSFAPPPAAAAWEHRDARTGFEATWFETRDDGLRIDGATSALEDGEAWFVQYAIHLDSTWTTRSARVSGRSASGTRSTAIEADGAGRWRVDGEAAPALDGCLDVDLASSAVTNALPVHRMGLAVGSRAEAPAAYVRATDLAVEVLEQTYQRVDDEGSSHRYDYEAPVFEFACRLVYDEAGLVLDYPGLAVRRR